VSEPDPADYERLVEIAERELELLADGSLEELADLAEERADLIDRLPPTPPVWAAPALERAALAHRRVRIEIARSQEALMGELATVERAQRMASGYAPARRAGARVQTSA
jgi:hypothetical protein